MDNWLSQAKSLVKCMLVRHSSGKYATWVLFNKEKRTGNVKKCLSFNVSFKEMFTLAYDFLGEGGG